MTSLADLELTAAHTRRFDTGRRAEAGYKTMWSGDTILIFSRRMIRDRHRLLLSLRVVELRPPA